MSDLDLDLVLVLDLDLDLDLDFDFDLTPTPAVLLERSPQAHGSSGEPGRGPPPCSPPIATGRRTDDRSDAAARG